MKKLTDYQIENLIENIVQEKKHDKINLLKEHYIKKWNNCKTKKERFQFFNEFFSHRKELMNEGYSHTVIDENILSSLLGSGVGGFKSTFKEWIASKLVGFLGIDDPDLKRVISISIANLDWTKDWTKFLSPLKNCEYFASQIVHDVAEYYVAKKANQWFGSGVFADSLRNAVVDSLSTEDHVKKLEDSVTGVICGAIRKMFGGGISNTIKNLMGGEKKTDTGQSPQVNPSIS